MLMCRSILEISTLVILPDADNYCETDKDITWERDAAIKVRYGPAGTMEAMPSISVMSMMKSTVNKFPSAPALGK